VAKIVITHAVENVERWLGFKHERAAQIESMGGSNVVDHVATDGSNNVAITADVPDPAAFQAATAAPPPEMADTLQRHGVIPPVVTHVEK
jgi:hypothetical protein